MAAALRLGFFFFLFVLLHFLLLLSHPVTCDKDDNLLKDINKYRKSHNLGALKKHRRASCLAEEIAEDLSDSKRPCTAVTATSYISTQEQRQLVTSKHLKKCKLQANTTKEAVVMPVCVPDLDSTLLLRNYTLNSQFALYLNSLKYNGAGVGHEDDWMVVVLTARTPGGSFLASGAPAARCSSALLLLWFFLVLLVGLKLG